MQNTHDTPRDHSGTYRSTLTGMTLVLTPVSQNPGLYVASYPNTALRPYEVPVKTIEAMLHAQPQSLWERIG